MDYISAKEASVLWNITDQMIRRHCRNGRIPGSVQRNGTWYVPADAKKPAKLKPETAPLPKFVKQLQRQCIMRAAAATEAQSERPACPVRTATLRSRCATYLK